MVKLKDLHEFAVQEAIEKDPRSEDQIEDLLEKREEKFEELEGPRKEHYDEDRLENPYDDSKVLYGGDKDVQKIALGIDMEVPELLLVKRLNEEGKDIDCVVTHHPEGVALARLAGVMGLQVDVLSQAGVPVSQAEGLVKPRVDEVSKSVHPANHPRAPRTAELLDIPYMCLHTVMDNHAYSFMRDYLDEKDPERLDDIIDSLLEIPEYEWSLKYDMGPKIYSGDGRNRAGEIGVFGFTGGTDLGEGVIEKMVNSGIDTLIAMHAPKDQIEKADEHNINIITAGHMASDTLGINLVLDKAQEKFDFEVLGLSGFKRFKRS